MENSATEAKARYNVKKYDRFLITAPKGMKNDIDFIYSKLGYKSRNDFIVSSVIEKIDRIIERTDQRKKQR